MSVIAQSAFPFWFTDTATVVGVVGTFATLVGLYLTWVQVKETKKAAEAARFVVSQCYRLANEAKLFIEAQRLDVAAIRVNDLADCMVQLGRTLPSLVPSWEQYVSDLRDWDDTLRKSAAKQQALNTASERKWLDFYRQLLREFDRFHGPSENKEKERDSN